MMVAVADTTNLAKTPAEAGDAGGLRYRALTARRLVILALMLVTLGLSVALDMGLGPARYSLGEVLSALIDPAGVSDQLRVVIWDIRMPIALMAVTVGACLSLAGAQMQTILANPLASPFTLGISAAASFGAALALVAGVAVFPLALELMVPINAFLMAMLASMFIYAVSTLRGVTVETIVLLGIALVFTFNALLALLQYLASEQALAAVVFWTMGSLTKATWSKVAVTGAVLVVCVPLFARQAWALTALRLGDDKAASFGINVKRLRLETLMLVSLLAAIPVSFVGTIGFIGLVGPHIARMLLGEDQRFFLPGSLLCGALMLSATSVLSKMIIPGAILPIGVITALVGVPFFFSLIFTNRRRAW
ncbi:FecCD family ABC transporter permease [Pannonibacter carbonis]|uniref:FecCD family ABC transporter permease n=1 Tax=Pannonibacter carbonis TaxID=2067569 RepID=UPI003CC6DBD1